MSSSDKPALVPSIFKMKCPNCRHGHMFTEKHIFPLNKLLDMPEKCPVCSQKFEPEVGFYYGTGYVSYALSIVLIVAIWLFYWGVFGLSYTNNSVFYCLGLCMGLLIVMQPWLMRLSRVLYLYIFVKYGTGLRWKTEQ